MEKKSALTEIMFLVGITLITVFIQITDDKISSNNQELVYLQESLINSNGFSTNLGILSIISKLENNTLEELSSRSGMIKELENYDYTKNIIYLPKKNTSPVCWGINCLNLKRNLYIIQIIFICLLLGMSIIQFKRKN